MSRASWSVAAALLAGASLLCAPAAHASAHVHPANGVFKGALHYTLGNGSKESGKIDVTVSHHHTVSRLVMTGSIQGSALSTGLNCGAANLYDSKEKSNHVKNTHPSIAANGKFSTTLKGSFDTVVLKGRFTTAHKVSGTVRETSTDPVGGKCDSGTLPFTARG